MASLGRTAARIAGLGLAESDHQLLKALELGSTELQRISDSFSRMLPKQSKGLQIYSFLEGLPLTGLNVAGKYSSIIGDAHEGTATINADHMGMCRFNDRENSDYLLVSGVIRRWARLATAKWATTKPEQTEDVVETSMGSRVVIDDMTKPINLLSDIMLPLRLPQLPSRYFCGREKEISAIESAFTSEEERQTSQRIVVVHGLGGVGKTQVALSYGLQNRSTYKAIFWINATSESTILDHFRQIAQSLVDWAGQIRGTSTNFSRIAFDLELGQAVSPTTGEVSSRQNHSQLIVNGVKSWLEKNENRGWLMIFDAADDLHTINLPTYFPMESTGHILITSRRAQATQLGEGILLGCLEEDNATKLLLRQGHIDADQEDFKRCQRLSATLGYLPLALAQAGAYMATTKTSLETYMDLYRTKKENFLRSELASSVLQYKETVFTTWELSFAAISERDPRTATLLLLLAYMHPDDIWDGIFISGTRKVVFRQDVWEHFWNLPRNGRSRFLSFISATLKHTREATSASPIFELLESFTVDLSTLKLALSILKDYSLLQNNASGDGVRMHAMVREWCRHRATPFRQILSRTFIVLLGRAVARDIQGIENERSILRLAPHIPNALNVAQMLRTDTASVTLEVCYALECLIWFLGSNYSNHDGQDKKLVTEIVLNLSQQHFGFQNQLTFVLIGHLARASEEMGEISAAVQLARQRAGLCRKYLGMSDSDTLCAMNDLGNTMSKDRRFWSEARLVLKTTLDKRIELFGKCNETAQSMINLGMLLKDLNEIADSRKMLEEAAAISKLSDDWNLRLNSLLCLALVTSECGDHKQALELIQQAINLAESQFGVDSVITKSLQGQRAFHSMNTTAISDKHTLRHIELDLKGLLSQSPGPSTSLMNLATVKVNLANLYSSTGRSDKAEDLLRDVFNNSILGRNVGDGRASLDAWVRLALSYSDRGQFSEAIDLYDEIIAGCSDNVEIGQICRLNKAVALRDSGDLTKAEEIYKNYFSSCAPDDYGTLDYTNLASIYHLQGRFNEALALYQRTVASMKDNTAEKLLTLHGLASVYESIGDKEEAIRIMTSVFDAKVDVLGLCRTATLKTAIALRRMLAENNQARDAERIADRIRPFLEYA